MKRYIYILAPIVFLMLLFGNTKAAENGGYAGAFLKIPVEARPAAMGGAYIGVSDDAAGQLHNPAGLQSITTNVFTSSYRAMGQDRKLGFLSLSLPTRGESILGFSWLYAGYGSVEGRDNSGYATGEIISSNEHDFGITFAKRFEPFFAMGTKLNYYHKKHADMSVGSIGIDIGAMFFIDSLVPYGDMEGKLITDIKGGVEVKHLAAKYLWETDGTGLTPSQTDDFATFIGMGGSCRTIDRKLLLAVDLELIAARYPDPAADASFDSRISSTDFIFQAGAEYSFEKKYFLRAGINDGVFTAGGGFKYSFENLALSINYAFSDDRVGEGDDHIISLDVNF
jgi:hypothetical protein